MAYIDIDDLIDESEAAIEDLLRERAEFLREISALGAENERMAAERRTLREMLNQAERENADLRLQLAETWVPVEDGYEDPWGVQVFVDEWPTPGSTSGESKLTIWDTQHKYDVSIILPPNRRLCRRQEPIKEDSV